MTTAAFLKFRSLAGGVRVYFSQANAPLEPIRKTNSSQLIFLLTCIILPVYVIVRNLLTIAKELKNGFATKPPDRYRLGGAKIGLLQQRDDFCNRGDYFNKAPWAASALNVKR